MRIDNVNWMPWGDLIFTQGDLALSRYRGTLTYFNVQEPYHPDRLARQFRWHKSIPMDVIRPIDVYRLEKLDGRSHYSVTFSPDDDRWDIRWQSLVPIGVDAYPSNSMNEAYLQWHLSRTHPYLLQDSAQQLEGDNYWRPMPELDMYGCVQAMEAWTRDLEARIPGIGDAVRNIFRSQMPPPPIPPRSYNQGFLT